MIQPIVCIMIMERSAQALYINNIVYPYNGERFVSHDSYVNSEFRLVLSVSVVVWLYHERF